MDSSAPSAPRLDLSRLRPLLVGAITFAVFIPSLKGQFLIWDDDLNFLDNPHYRGFAWSHLRWMLTTFHMGHWHPLTWFTLALDYTIWGMNPLGYHLTSLLLHCANSVLLYQVLRTLLRLAGRSEIDGAAALGALFYSIHPLRVESVAWITERRDVLCGFFTLLALLAYLKRVEEERCGRPATRWLILSILAFAASLLSKALSIALPAILLLIDLYPLRRFTPGSRGRILLEKLPFALLSGADAAVMLFAMRDIDMVHSAGGYELGARGAQAAYGLCFYWAKTIWPTKLIPIYPIETIVDPTRPIYLGAIALVVAVTALFIALRRRRPEALAAWVSYGALVFPVLGVAVAGMQIAADRYTYLAMLPASVLLAAALRSRAARAVAGGVLAILAILTWNQCYMWHDTVTLWTREIEQHPGLYFPYACRGTAKAALGDLDGAIADFDRSLSINPLWTIPLSGRAGAHAARGDHVRAFQDFNRLLQLDPRDAGAFAGRALSRARMGDQQGAIADSTRSLELRPGHVPTLANRAMAYTILGDARRALADYDEILRLAPEPGFFVRRAAIRGMLGDLDGVIADTGEAIRLKPDLYDAYVPRGGARMRRGDREGAAQDFSRALELAPPAWPHRPEVEKFLQEARGSR